MSWLKPDRFPKVALQTDSLAIASRFIGQTLGETCHLIFDQTDRKSIGFRQTEGKSILKIL